MKKEEDFRQTLLFELYDFVDRLELERDLTYISRDRLVCELFATTVALLGDIEGDYV